jgi:hypothetical protein
LKTRLGQVKEGFGLAPVSHSGQDLTPEVRSYWLPLSVVVDQQHRHEVNTVGIDSLQELVREILVVVSGEAELIEPLETLRSDHLDGFHCVHPMPPITKTTPSAATT